MKKLLLICLLCFFLPTAGAAKISLGTTTEPHNTEVTIYSNEQLALIREERTVRLNAGTNRLRFSWENTRIDPTSVRLDFTGDPAEIELLNTVYPADDPTMIIWEITAENPTLQPVEVSYFSLGIEWSANYRASLDRKEENIRLVGNIRIKNNSGRNLENTRFNLFIGEVTLLDELAETIREWEGKLQSEDNRWLIAENAAMYAPAARRPRQEAVRALMEAPTPFQERRPTIEQQAEHHLLLIEQPTDLNNNWQKQLEFLPPVDVPVKTVYQFSPETTGEAVLRRLEFDNDPATNLGTKPLPAGKIEVRGEQPDGGLKTITSSELKYLPVNGTGQIELGPDAKITAESSLMNQRSDSHLFDEKGRLTGWVEEEEKLLKINNHRRIPVEFEIYRNFPDPYWKVITSSKNFTRKTARRLYFKLTVPPAETSRIKYTVRRPKGELRD